MATKVSDGALEGLTAFGFESASVEEPQPEFPTLDYVHVDAIEAAILASGTPTRREVLNLTTTFRAHEALRRLGG